MNGHIRINHPGIEPEDMPEKASCSLDLADDNTWTLDKVGQFLGFTRERARQIEAKCMRKFRALGLDAYFTIPTKNNH